MISGLAAIPLLLAKLWTVIPKLWERPALRSLARGPGRAGGDAPASTEVENQP